MEHQGDRGIKGWRGVESRRFDSEGEEVARLERWKRIEEARFNK